ncbi:MAG: hypothetical protein ACXVPU_19260, partial [Bacteroidia bacterium]
MSLIKKLDGIFDFQTKDLNLNQNHRLQGLNGSAFAFFIQSLYSSSTKNIVIIASEQEKAAYILNDVEALLKDQKTLFFPETYRQPYQIEKTTNANIQERTEVLN